MDQLRDALKKMMPEAAAATPAVSTPVEAPALPDPLKSEWIRRYRELGGEVPPNPSWGQLTQRSDKLARELKTGGRARDAAALQKLRDDFTSARATRAWTLVKARFAELELSERTYRALKQSDVEPTRILERISGKRGEALRGTGADRLRELLS